MGFFGWEGEEAPRADLGDDVRVRNVGCGGIPSVWETPISAVTSQVGKLRHGEMLQWCHTGNPGW